MAYRFANDPYYIRGYKEKKRGDEYQMSLSKDNLREMRNLIKSVDHLVDEMERENQG